ncbi:anthrone oxygenase family protein [Actinoalloteichus hymeniacidonis]|uniref:Integral membrane protein n=1 Tax=Actinoalloteichus hymeniacidonis TaxID=340345 RepID=A0AAC9HP76_9PSEU|nr:DUF1772 domain-containing protein [Actinoalloteichus hymeniacidonis]AOS62902.1 putative integral membrane protein [Actinoalloteichus hymeniacidonis]MBB5909065.1 putative membrane protein [Actinoalloteichus hymeniacidonis]
MTVLVLGTAAVLGSSVVAGVLFAVALSVLPAMIAMPPDRYVYTHRLIGRNWDPTMPILVLSSTTVCLVLAFLVPEGSRRLLYLLAAALLAAVSVVSHFCNVPINRRVKVLDPESMPADWSDPRPLWRRWHAARTVLSLLAALSTTVSLGLG